MPGAFRLPWFTVYGVTPDKKQKEEFLVSADYVDSLRDRRIDTKYDDSFLLPEILGDPTSTCQGLKRPGFEGAFCYCGKPKQRFMGEQVVAFSSTGEVFAVYVVYFSERDALVAYDWDWLEEDKSVAGHPISWQTNYTRRIWPTS